MYNLFAYPGEKPFLDFSGETKYGGSTGITLSGGYWHIKGLEIYNSGGKGFYISGSSAAHNIVENCSIHNSGDTGLQISNSANSNYILNCDSYFSRDASMGNADGFSPKLTVGTGNRFYGCRSWQNSDDAYDGYMRTANDDVYTTYVNCWAFCAGYLIDGTIGSGDGNGFKTGGSDDKNLRHNATYVRCLSFNNKSKGFDQNSNLGSVTIVNCTSLNNIGNNYSWIVPLAPGKTLVIENSIAYGGKADITIDSILVTNDFNCLSADFVTLDTTGVRNPRKADGSLPEIQFMHLRPGSRLIDAGTSDSVTTAVGLVYTPPKPDLGCFEYGAILGVKDNNTTLPNTFSLSQNYPNPFNPTTIISYQLSVSGMVTLKVYNILGQEVATLVNSEKAAGEYKVSFNASNLPSGIYLYQLRAGNFVETKKMMLMK
jgi:hypothetical protein